jgi:hypothetical protein
MDLARPRLLCRKERYVPEPVPDPRVRRLTTAADPLGIHPQRRAARAVILALVRKCFRTRIYTADTLMGHHSLPCSI